MVETYFASVRHFIKITPMKNTFLVPIQKNDFSIKSIVSQFQSLIFP